MNFEDCRPGRIVYSTKGRDKGRYFLIMSILSEDRITVADGKTHTIEEPKKKNIKHLKATPFSDEEVKECLEEKKRLENHQVYKALVRSGYISELTHKEECDIVQK